MPNLETPDELADFLADQLGVYGAHDASCTEQRPCRPCYVSELTIRIRQAVRNESMLAAVEDQAKLLPPERPFIPLETPPVGPTWAEAAATRPVVSYVAEYLALVDQLRESRRVSTWIPAQDRPLLASLEDLYEKLGPTEQQRVEREGWRAWPSEYDSRPTWARWRP